MGAGLPIGLQLMGRAWAEADLLSTGAVLEAAVGALVHTPTIIYDLLCCSLVRSLGDCTAEVV